MTNFSCLLPLLLLTGLILGPNTVSAEGPSLEELRNTRAEQEARIEQAREGAQKAVDDRFREALERLQASFQQQGDLDSLLVVREALGDFDRGKPVPESKPSDLDGLAQARTAYHTARGRIASQHARAVLDLNRRYARALKQAIGDLTQEGKLEEAVAARQALAALLPENTKPTPVPATPAYGFQWSTATGPMVRIFGGDRGPLQGLRHEGKNKLHRGTVGCAGGRTFVDGVGEDLLAACKASNELTLAAEFETGDLTQKGPARIVSFSIDSQRRNVTLGQENGRLVLRLRTTQTGDNGTGPEVDLGPFEADRRTKVVLSYRPGTLAVMVNGKTRDVQQIDGDFSNWEAAEMLLGNEWKDRRPWRGEVHGFLLRNRYTPPEKMRGLLPTR